jgi:cytochrome c553
MKSALVLAATAVLALTSIAAQAAGDIKAGQEKAKTCAACHGADGNSTSGQFPRLAGQHADYLVQALKEYADGQRQNPIMKGFAANLTEQDREDLAAWFASQSDGVFSINDTKLSH